MVSGAEWAENDKVWFRQLFTSYRQWLLDTIAQLLPADTGHRTEEVSEVLCQEIFAAAWAHRDEVPDDPRPWLREKARKAVRKLSRRRPEPAPVTAEITEDSWDAVDLDVEISTAIDRLPAAERSIVTSHLRGYTHREIARKQQMTEDAVRKSFSRSMLRLRTRLGLTRPDESTPDNGAAR